MAGPRMGGHGHRGPMMPGEKAKDFKGTMGKLLGYLKKFLPGIVLVLICAAASTIFSIFGPKVLGQATTKLFEGLIAMLTGTGGIDFTAIAQILLFLAALYLISALLTYVQGWVMSGVATKLSYNMRKDISEKIDRMPLSYFDRVSNGEVLSRITNDVDTITQTLNQSLSQIVTNVTMMVGVLCMMLSISPLMTLVVLCILPLSVLIVTQVVKRSQPFFRKQQEYLGHVNGHVEEMYGSHLIVTAFNGQEDSIEEFKKLNDNLYHAAWKSQFISSTMQPLMNFVSNLGYVGICVLGGCPAVYPANQPDCQHLQRFADDSSSGREGLCLFGGRRGNCRPAAVSSGRKYRRLGLLCTRSLRLCAGKNHHQRFFRHHPAGHQGGNRRTDRSGQDYNGQAAHAFL